MPETCLMRSGSESSAVESNGYGKCQNYGRVDILLKRAEYVHLFGWGEGGKLEMKGSSSYLHTCDPSHALQCQCLLSFNAAIK